MEIMDKLKILADSAKYDASCSSSGSSRKNKNKTNKKLPKTNVSSNSILVPTLLGIASIITIKKKYK